MVRRCAVKNCNSTDINIISHRFPRSEKSAATWRDALDIQDIPLQHLISKYVVCTLHFSRTDYRNAQSNFLNSTAIPKKPETDPETPEKYSLMGMLGDYYGKPMSTYRKDRRIAHVKTDKSIMVYEISELEDIEALQETQPNVEEEIQLNDNKQDEHEVIEVIGDDENDLEDGDDDEIIVEYVSQHKKQKFDPETTYVRLENNVVVALSEQEEDDGEDCYEEQEDEHIEYHDETNPETESIDILFLEKDPNDEIFIDEELVQQHTNDEQIDENRTKLLEKIEEPLNDDEPNDEHHEEPLITESYYDEGEYAEYTRKDLIEKLIQSISKNQELETKLESIQSAQAEMVKSIENFKKIFNS